MQVSFFIWRASNLISILYINKAANFPILFINKQEKNLKYIEKNKKVVRKYWSFSMRKNQDTLAKGRMAPTTLSHKKEISS